MSTAPPIPHGVTPPGSAANAAEGATASQTGGAGLERVLAGVIAIGLSLIIAAAAWLEPSPKGYGTHRQFGLPPCGWIAAFDLPCPACGMTTSFALAADGRLMESIAVQPFGFLLATATVAGAILAALQAIMGWQFSGLLVRVLNGKLAIAIGVAVLLAWIWKVALVKDWL